MTGRGAFRRKDRVVVNASSGAITDPRNPESKDNPVFEVEGFTGEVESVYESNITGKATACIRADHGGGVMGVPTERLVAQDLGPHGGGNRSFGFTAATIDWDQVFGKKKRKKRRAA